MLMLHPSIDVGTLAPSAGDSTRPRSGAELIGGSRLDRGPGRVTIARERRAAPASRKLRFVAEHGTPPPTVRCRPIIEEEATMATGTVKWFNPTKGFGFIQPDAGGAGRVRPHQRRAARRAERPA